jgi:hypothetical protein
MLMAMRAGAAKDEQQQRTQDKAQQDTQESKGEEEHDRGAAGLQQGLPQCAEDCRSSRHEGDNIICIM